jgi:hypothetical protein
VRDRNIRSCQKKPRSDGNTTGHDGNLCSKKAHDLRPVQPRAQCVERENTRAQPLLWARLGASRLAARQQPPQGSG